MSSLTDISCIYECYLTPVTTKTTKSLNKCIVNYLCLITAFNILSCAGSVYVTYG
jgi:hypothetical protein